MFYEPCILELNCVLTQVMHKFLIYPWRKLRTELYDLYSSSFSYPYLSFRASICISQTRKLSCHSPASRLLQIPSFFPSPPTCALPCPSLVFLFPVSMICTLQILLL
jgi:hypothetical protein